MSIHNLSEQLSWLLSDKPFITPPVPAAVSVEISVQDIPSSNTEEQLLSDEELLQHEDTSQPQIQSIEAQGSLAEDTSAAMARLRTNPSPTKKPRLLAQASCQTPGRQNGGDVRAEHDTNQRRQRSDLWPRVSTPIVDFHKSSHSEAIAPTRAEPAKNQISRTPRPVEFVDLSDSPGAQPGSEKLVAPLGSSRAALPTSHAGRKRKSGEFEEDLAPNAHERQRAKMNDRAKRVASPDYQSIEECNDSPDHELVKRSPTALSPPPPYSTHAPLDHVVRPIRARHQPQSHPHCVASQAHSPRPPGLQEDMSQYFSQSSSTQGPSRAPSRTENHGTSRAQLDDEKQRESPWSTISTPEREVPSSVNRPIANTPSKLRRQVDRDTGASRENKPTTTKPASIKRNKRAPRRLVQDSDDEEMEDADLEGSEHTYHQASPSPKKSIKPPPSSELAAVIKRSPKMDDVLPKQPASSTPTKLPPRPIGATPVASHSSTSAKSESERSSQTTFSTAQPGDAWQLHLPPGFLEASTVLVANDSPPLIRGFAQFSEFDLNQQKISTSAEYERVSECWLDLEDDMDAAHEATLQEHIRLLKEKVESLTKLQEVRKDLCSFSHFREAVKRQALSAMGSKDALPLKTRLKQIKEKTKALELHITRLIESADLEIQPRSPEPSRIAVTSTQVPPKHASSTQVVPDSTPVRTQFVQQTQASRPAPVPQQNSTRPTDIQITTSRMQESIPPHPTLSQSRNMGRYNAEDEDSLLQFEEDEYNVNCDEEADMLNATNNFETQARQQSGRPTPKRDAFAEREVNTVSQPQMHKAGAFVSKPAKTFVTERPSDHQHRWSVEVNHHLQKSFRLKGFRLNQLNAINATLAGKHAFVLMPTGGGKSLCYQLPSCVRSGITRGVTVVISPLMSLMEDQVSHLQQLKLQASLLNGDTPYDSRKIIYNALDGPDPGEFIQLLYVTPEMLGKSNALLDKLKSLYKREELARIVIDEAHCVSQWGHDFRPDYKNLGDVCEQFSGVPLMALTATATENVKVDVIHNLHIDGCEVFTQSFNRPNLFYEVRKKKRNDDVLDSMTDTIKTLYKNQCGIVYCLSRKKCEDVAEKLREKYKLKAEHYHAHISGDEKRRVQRDWQSGKVHIIVATIAFGMGIDKPDVRFVMHQSIPKSLEGYYQETGRAGRDGKTSGCYLYYGYQDCAILKRMIEDNEEGSREQKDRQLNMLRQMIVFCENEADCRRVQVLNYFGEQFHSDDCGGQCDNCNSTSTFETRDFTDHASAAISLVRGMQDDHPTMMQCVDVFRGTKNKKAQDREWIELPAHGFGADTERNDIERLFYRLLNANALTEVNTANKGGFAQQFVVMGPRGPAYRDRKHRVELHVRIGESTKKKVPNDGPSKRPGAGKRSAGGAPSRLRQPLSTFVSSPMPHAARRKQRQVEEWDDTMDDEVDATSRTQASGRRRHEQHFSKDDEEDEDYEDFDDGFQAVRDGTRNRAVQRPKALGDPITVDQQLQDLGPLHQVIVHQFVAEAAEECKKIIRKRGLGRPPFTETTLREMAIWLPKNKEQLGEIQGVDQDKVDHYGDKMLELIRRHRSNLEQHTGGEKSIHDPNREIVDLLSDAEEELQPPASMEESSQEQISPHFQQNPRVKAFNEQMANVESQHVPVPRPRAESRAPTSKDTWRKKPRKEGNGKPYRRSNYPKKQPRKSESEGVKKRKSSTAKPATKKTASTSRPSGNQDNRSERGQSTIPNGGGIGMMPT